MLLGVYHPRLLLITTPSYTFNARFTAPDAPESARSGFRDPTGRTSRIFRHSDHKFEWTVEEFTQWCVTTAVEWGYDVEVSGVGRAQEQDEWGRDDDLGCATQVAMFRKKESDVLARMRAAKTIGVLERARRRPKHVAVADHHYEEHELAGRPNCSRDIISNIIKRMMQEYQEAKMTVHEIWFEKKITTICGGFLHHLILALEADEELFLHRHGRKPLDWVVEFNGLIREEPIPGVDARLEIKLTETDGPPVRTECHPHSVGLETADSTGGWQALSPDYQWGDVTSGDVTWGNNQASQDTYDWGTESWKDGVATEA